MAPQERVGRIKVGQYYNLRSAYLKFKCILFYGILDKWKNNKIHSIDTSNYKRLLRHQNNIHFQLLVPFREKRAQDTNQQLTQVSPDTLLALLCKQCTVTTGEGKERKGEEIL